MNIVLEKLRHRTVGRAYGIRSRQMKHIQDALGAIEAEGRRSGPYAISGARALGNSYARSANMKRKRYLESRLKRYKEYRAKLRRNSKDRIYDQDRYEFNLGTAQGSEMPLKPLNRHFEP